MSKRVIINNDIKNRILDIKFDEDLFDDTHKVYSSIRIHDDGKFVRYFENGAQTAIRDSDLLDYNELAVGYARAVREEFTEASFYTEFGDELVELEG